MRIEIKNMRNVILVVNRNSIAYTWDTGYSIKESDRQLLIGQIEAYRRLHVLMAFLTTL